MVAALKGDHPKRKRGCGGRGDRGHGEQPCPFCNPALEAVTQHHFCHILWLVDGGPRSLALPTPLSPTHTAESTSAQVLSFGKGFSLWLPTIHWKIRYLGVSKAEAP